MHGRQRYPTNKSIWSLLILVHGLLAGVRWSNVPPKIREDHRVYLWSCKHCTSELRMPGRVTDKLKLVKQQIGVISYFMQEDFRHRQGSDYRFIGQYCKALARWPSR